MNFAAGLDIFLADSAATMTVGVGTPFPVIFNEPGQEVQLFDGAVISSGPVALAKSANIAANAVDNGVAVVINDPDTGVVNAPFIVTTVKPDGLGFAVVTLTKG